MIKNTSKEMVAYRLRKDVLAVLKKLATKTGKTKTKLIEEAILLHGKSLG